MKSTKIYQPKVEMQKRKKKEKRNPPKNEREREREITFCAWENYAQNERVNCKFIVRGQE